MSDLLTALNLALASVLPFAFPIFIGRCMGLRLLNFWTLPILANLPILLMTLIGGPTIRLSEGVNDPYYQEWLTITNLHQMLQIVVTSLLFVIVLQQRSISSERLQSISPRYLEVAAVLFLGLFVLSFVATAGFGYGILNWIINPRIGYQDNREGLGPFYALMTTSLALSVFFSLCSNKRAWSLLFTLIIFMPLMYLIGTKGFIIRMFLLALGIYLFKFRRVPISLMIIGGLSVTGLVLLNFGSVDFIEIFNYFEYFPHSTAIYDAIVHGRLPLYHGELTVSEFWGMVPRGLFPDKPVVYGKVILSDLVAPGAAAGGRYVDFGGPITAYGDFGVLGVVLSALLQPGLYLGAILTGRVARAYIDLGPHAFLQRPNLVLVLLYLINPDAFSYFVFPLNIIYFLFICAVVLVASRLWVSFGREPEGPLIRA